MENFTPVSALVGGLMIGASATLLLWLNGRIAGISNIARGVLEWRPGDIAWRLLFLGGLVAGAGLYYGLFGNAPVPRADFPVWLLGVGGVLVGFGTALGSGCTSGHGVCGLARLSPRSFVAVVTFLAAGIATVLVMRVIS